MDLSKGAMLSYRYFEFPDAVNHSLLWNVIMITNYAFNGK